MPHVTRQDLEAVIDRGEYVIHQGQHIASKDDLPSEADLKKLHSPTSRDAIIGPAGESDAHLKEIAASLAAVNARLDAAANQPLDEAVTEDEPDDHDAGLEDVGAEVTEEGRASTRTPRARG